MADEKPFSFPLNHVAVSVPDVLAAAKWYKEILGFQELRPPMTMDRAKTPDGIIFKLYPNDMNKVTICAMSTGNGVGFELFQFHDPKIEEGAKANFANDYKRGGFFHIGVTTPDLNTMCAKVINSGGKMIGERIPVYEHEAVYMEDPWGNVVELISVSFERAMSNRT